MNINNTPILVLYCKTDCPFSNKVLKFIKQINKKLTVKNIDIDHKALDELAHLGGKVQTPCLFIDGKPLYDSENIIDWIKSKKDIV